MSPSRSLPPFLIPVLTGIVSIALCGCGEDTPAESSSSAGFFREVAAARGLHLDVDRADVDDFFMPESMAGGGALFDADGDGDLDVYLVNGWWDGEADAEKGRNRLFLLQPDGTYEDATDRSGLGHGGYGMGVAIGDYDNDGDLDVFVTNYGPDVLFRNDGEGRFTDVTDEAGVGCSAWGASAGFVDYDGDGDLDLFVTCYVEYDPRVNRGVDLAGRPEYPGPATLKGVTDRLYRNVGGKRFEDDSERAGIAGKRGKGLGVVFLDLNDDGLIDIYVANDREANFAWINQAGSKFEDRALRLGLAHNEMSQPEASMGIAVGDADGNGHLDLLLTHLVAETHTLYAQTSAGRWRDVTFERGLAAPTRNDTGWGTGFADFDHDGDEDLVVVNGRVIRAPPPAGTPCNPHWSAYAAGDSVFWNDGGGKFERAGREGAAFTSAPEVGRGLLVGDVDADGDLDLVVTTANGTVRLFLNDVPKHGRWMKVRAIDPALKRDALGAVVTVVAGGRSRVRLVSHTCGYLTSGDATVHVGLGGVTRVDEIRVRWPDGRREMFGPFDPDRRVVVQRGAGREVR
ncbi:MAG: hypothetical protein CMJ83_12835 [Planctomycetes bacterium]|nr:hypothetical protein [Planctomycetota bacterium]